MLYKHVSDIKSKMLLILVSWMVSNTLHSYSSHLMMTDSHGNLCRTYADFISDITVVTFVSNTVLRMKYLSLLQTTFSVPLIAIYPYPLSNTTF